MDEILEKIGFINNDGIFTYKKGKKLIEIYLNLNRIHVTQPYRYDSYSTQIHYHVKDFINKEFHKEVVDIKLNDILDKI